MGYHAVQSLTVNGKRYDSFPDREAREDMEGKLPQPAGNAAAGQLLAVEEVDENGVVRAVRAVEAPQAEHYVLPVAGTELGGVKNGGNVTVNPDGTMDAPEAQVADEQVADAVSGWLAAHPEATTTVADGAVTTEKLADGAVTPSKLGHSEDEYVGNIGDRFYVQGNFAYKTASSKPIETGTCRLYKAKAGDVFCITNLAPCGSSWTDTYDHIHLIERDLSTVTVLQKITVANNSRHAVFAVEQDCYVMLNEQTNLGTRTVFNVYRNAFVDACFVPEMFDRETALALTDGMQNRLKGIVTTNSANIAYEPGYYAAYTNGHEIISFPNIVMINGDVVYYDGEWFHHCPELTKRSTPVKKSHYDVLVIGSGASGISTALNLAGLGKKVAVIEKNHHLGGTHTCAGVIDMCASPADDSLKQVVLDAWEDGYASMGGSVLLGTTDRSDTFDLRWNGSHLNWPKDNASTNTSGGAQGNHITIDPHYLQQYYYRKLREGGVDVFLDTEIVDAAYDGEYLRSVTAEDGRVFSANYFVDAGDNIIVRKTGEMDADYFYGYDGSARFGEDKVLRAEPDTGIINKASLGAELLGGYKMFIPHHETVGTSMTTWKHAAYGQDCKYTTSAKWIEAHPLQSLGKPDSFSIPTATSTPGFDLIGAKELMENGEAKTRAKYIAAALRGTTPVGTVEVDYREPNEMLGIRESYRLNAVYNGTQTDCETMLTELGSNSILASWYTEIHGINGVNRTLFRPLVGLPIQTMFSPKFKNYINPSKNKGVSHLAHSTFRLTRTCWLSGRLAAEILKLCWETTPSVHGVDVAAVNANSGVTALFAELQSYIAQRA